MSTGVFTIKKGVWGVGPLKLELQAVVCCGDKLGSSTEAG